VLLLFRPAVSLHGLHTSEVFLCGVSASFFDEACPVVPLFTTTALRLAVRLPDVSLRPQFDPPMTPWCLFFADVGMAEAPLGKYLFFFFLSPALSASPGWDFPFPHHFFPSLTPTSPFPDHVVFLNSGVLPWFFFPQFSLARLVFIALRSFFFFPPPRTVVVDPPIIVLL